MKKAKLLYLGLDIGGTGVKAGVVDANGNLLGLARRGYIPDTPAAGQAQIPIATIETAAKEVVREVVKTAATPIRAMSISSQGQTFVALDARDKPLHPAIMWYDGRAERQAARLRRELLPFAGNPECPGMPSVASAAKIAWLHENQPGLRENTARYLLLPDYFAYRLSGRAVSDPNTASSSGLCCTGDGGYFQPAMEKTGVSSGQFATIQPSGSPIGKLKKDAAEAWGLTPETMLVTGTNDQYAGALGAGNCLPGILTVTTGTCLALVTLTEKPPDRLEPGLSCGFFPLKPYRFILAYTKTAGIVLDWFLREFAPECSPAELDRLADEIPAGCNGLTALPHFDGVVSTPDPLPHARGLFAGLTLQHGRNAMYRALMESIAFCLRESLEAMCRSGLRINTVRAIGGASKSAVWMQMQSDVVNMPIEQPLVTEAAVLGAAMLAAAGCGDFDNLQESAGRMYRAHRVFSPNRANREAYEQAYRAYHRWMKCLKFE